MTNEKVTAESQVRFPKLNFQISSVTRHSLCAQAGPRPLVPWFARLSCCIFFYVLAIVHVCFFEKNWSRDGLRLKSDNLRRCCRLQDREAQCKGGVRADGVSSLIVAAGERRGSLGVGFENMMRSWVMK